MANNDQVNVLAKSKKVPMSAPITSMYCCKSYLLRLQYLNTKCSDCTVKWKNRVKKCLFPVIQSYHLQGPYCSEYDFSTSKLSAKYF